MSAVGTGLKDTRNREKTRTQRLFSDSAWRKCFEILTLGEGSKKVRWRVASLRMRTGTFKVLKHMGEASNPELPSVD